MAVSHKFQRRRVVEPDSDDEQPRSRQHQDTKPVRPSPGLETKPREMRRHDESHLQHQASCLKVTEKAGESLTRSEELVQKIHKLVNTQDIPSSEPKLARRTEVVKKLDNNTASTNQKLKTDTDTVKPLSVKRWVMQKGHMKCEKGLVARTSLHNRTKVHHDMSMYSHSAMLRPDEARRFHERLAVSTNPMLGRSDFTSLSNKKWSGGDCQQQQRRRRKVSRPSPLLDLPGELRNRIYEYVIPELRVLICGNHPNKELAALKKLWVNEGQQVKKPPFKLGCQLDNKQIRDGLEVSSSLLLSCRKIKSEVECFLYSRTTFCFDRMKHINQFLNRSSKNGIRTIRRLELCHDGYGEASNLLDARFKTKHDAKWTETCQRIHDSLTSLDSLELRCRVRDWPSTLTMKDQWCKTLLLLIGDRELDHVRIYLDHNRYSDKKVAAMSRKLENRMMTKEGCKKRDLAEMLKQIQEFERHEAEHRAYLAQLPPVRTKAILKIRLEDAAQGTNASDAAPGKSYKHSLAVWEQRHGTKNTASKLLMAGLAVLDGDGGYHS